MRLYVKRKRNGTRVWWASWTENKVTVRRSTRQETRELAQLVVDVWSRERADPERQKARQATFGTEAAIFLKECHAAKLAAGTVSMYEQKLANLCDVLGRNTSMVAITPERVDEYFTLRRDEGAEGSTLYKEWVALHGVLKSARHRGRYTRDPKQVRPLWLTPSYEPRKTFLTWAQADELLEELPSDRARTVAFVLATGARRREWERARAGDVDLTTWRVKIRGTKTAAALRTVPVPEPMRRWLELAGEPPFAPWGNARRDIHEACRRIRDRQREAGTEPTFPNVTWNDLRRTFASLLVQAGVAPHLVARLLGHTTTAMVDRVYGRQTDGSLEELVARALDKRKP